MDRKSAQELTANDYRSFSHPMLEHQSITLINDSYDGRVENCSIATATGYTEIWKAWQRDLG